MTGQGDLYRDERPAVPADLVPLPVTTLLDIKSQLLRIMRSIQCQLGLARPRLQGTEPATKAEYDELVRWQRRAKHALASVCNDLSRVKQELGRRTERPVREGGMKGKRSGFVEAVRQFAAAVAEHSENEEVVSAAYRLLHWIDAETYLEDAQPEV